MQYKEPSACRFCRTILDESGECPRCARYEEHVSTRNSQQAAERKKLLVALVVLSILWIAAVSVYVSNSASAPKSIVRSITDDSAAATQNRPLTPEQHLDLAGKLLSQFSANRSEAERREMISAIEEHLDAANNNEAVQKRLTELRAQLRAKEDEAQGELVWNSPDAPFHAEQTCREAVEKGLLAPGTADFVDHQSKQLAGHPGWFLVTETVDAANAFNAKLRNEFVCKVSCSSPESCTTIDSPRQQ